MASTVPYCTVHDVYRLALAAPAFVVRPRPVEASDPATGILRLTAHGLDTLDAVTAVVTSGGTLPTGLSAAALYAPSPVSADLLRLAPVGGSPIVTFGSTGSGWALSVDPERRLHEHILDASARIDQMLLAHAAPLVADPVSGRYPLLIVGVCARMAARSAAISLQVENATFRAALDRLFAAEGETEKPAPGTDRWLLKSWIEGMPIRPEPVAQTTAPTAAPRATSRSPMGWTVRRGL